MDIPESLQPRVLLSKPVTLVEHLRGLLAADSSLDSLNSINAYLLHLVHEEAVPWRIFQTWLFLIWPTSPVFLRDAIRDEESVGVQIAGIQVLKHAFRRPSARPRIWDALGGPAGVKSLIDGLSLRQATSFVKALCQSGRGMHNDILLGYFDELVSLLEASDELGARPLSLDAMSLYACCSPQRVAEALESGRIETRTIERDLLRTQLNVLRLVAVGVVDAPEQFRTHILRDHADILLASNEAYVPTSPVKVDAGVPAGVLFGMDLMWHIDRSKSAPWTEREGRHLINKWAKKIVHLAIRRNVSIDVLCAIISACLGLLCDGDRSHWIDRCKKCHCENWVSDILPFEVIRCWSTARFGVCADELPFYSSIKIKRNSPSWPTPDYVTALESCMVNDVFMLIDKQELAWLHDRPVGLSRYLSRMVERVPIDKRIEFLQLVCKHCPTLSFDLTMWPPSEREAEVLPIWDIALLSKMPLTRSKELFERSLHVNNCETFISDDLLKKNDWAMTWEEQCMLWSGWETLSAKTHQDFKITQQALVKIKQKAVEEKDGESRLNFAKTALATVSATQSLAFFHDLIQWLGVFSEDMEVFPKLLVEICKSAAEFLSCEPHGRILQPYSTSNLSDLAIVSNLALRDLLKVVRLRSSVTKSYSWLQVANSAFEMFAKVIDKRVTAVHHYLLTESSDESELTRILLESLVPIIVEHERETSIDGGGENADGWGQPGRSGVPASLQCPPNPSSAYLAFVDFLAKARDQLWTEIRANNEPKLAEFGPGWPRGLAIQHLSPDHKWLCYALLRPKEAPFLSCKVNELLFSPGDIILDRIPPALNPGERPEVVDSLLSVIRAITSNGADGKKWVSRVWSHYSTVLSEHPLYLKLSQDWLLTHGRLEFEDEVKEVSQLHTHPKVIPMVSTVPLNLSLTKWDPLESLGGKPRQSDASLSDLEPKEIPGTILTCRMGYRHSKDGFVHLKAGPKTKAQNPISMLNSHARSVDQSKDASFGNREARILASLLFLDTLNPQPRLLTTSFPNQSVQRFGPVMLAEGFLARVAEYGMKDSIPEALIILRDNAVDVPARMLQNLIQSLLKTVRTSSKAADCSSTMACAMKLVQILVYSSRPRLAEELIRRLARELGNDMLMYCKFEVDVIGRALSYSQAHSYVEKCVESICNEVQASEGQSRRKKNRAKKSLIKLVKSLARADYLAQSAQLRLLEQVCEASNYNDVRLPALTAILKKTRTKSCRQALKALSNLAALASGPNETVKISEQMWQEAENTGHLPRVETSKRPILEIFVSGAKEYLPEEVMSAYVQEVLIPLVENSIRQHGRWMSVFLGKIGLSLTGLELTPSDIGPFAHDLIDQILHDWTKDLPCSFLQLHRGWELVFRGRKSFEKIYEALNSSVDEAKHDSSTDGHMYNLWRSHCKRRPLRFIFPLLGLSRTQMTEGVSDELSLQEFNYRLKLFSESPLVFKKSSATYVHQPAYTLAILAELRLEREKYPYCSAPLYNHITALMTSIYENATRLRNEPCVLKSSSYPMTVASRFEYDVQLLPSPSRTTGLDDAADRAQYEAFQPASSSEDTTTGADPVLSRYVSAIIDLVTMHAADPVLLIKFDSLAEVLNEVPYRKMLSCALLLGQDFESGSNSRTRVIAWARVRLAISLLEGRDFCKAKQKNAISDMIDKWKRCDVEIIRQEAWAWELKDKENY